MDIKTHLQHLDLTLPVLVAVVAVLYQRYYKSGAVPREGALVPTKAPIDGETYYVLDTTNRDSAANLIATVKQQVRRILDYLHTMVESGSITDSDMRAATERLLAKHNGGTHLYIHELDPAETEAIAYNRNKSEAIFVCLRQQPPYKDLASCDTILFIILHELAHSMQDGYAPLVNGHTQHNKRFRDYEAFLMRIAQQLRFLIPQNIPNRLHCGRIMPQPADAP